MHLYGTHYRTIWLHPEDPACVCTFDQRRLPFELVVEELRSYREAAAAIREMHVRGAPLIGSTAAYGMYLAGREARREKNPETYLENALQELAATRPTAVDLFHALDRCREVVDAGLPLPVMAEKLRELAGQIAQESVDTCRRIGEHGLPLIRAIAARKPAGEPVRILTHCNAGWLACIDYGTATAPMYLARQGGIPLHVWVDETRPRNQGARLTAFELGQEGIAHQVITDNAGGHLMQNGLVDLVVVGTDRTTRRGDVANKIGTYLKALAARDNDIPFYVALPSSTIDWRLTDGLADIPIEERSEDEVHYVEGWTGSELHRVRVSPQGSRATNYGFDVTPARLVTGLITERGLCPASEAGLLGLFPEQAKPITTPQTK